MSGQTFFRMLIKKQARMMLHQNPIKFLGVVAVYVVLTFVLSALGAEMAYRFPIFGERTDLILTLGTTSLSMVFTAPLMAGLYDQCVKVAFGKTVSLMDGFLWAGEFPRVWRSLCVGFFMMIVTVALSTLAVVCPQFILEAAGRLSPELFESWLFQGLYFLLTTGLLILVSTEINLYTAAYILLAGNPKKSPLKCILESRKILKPYRWDYFMFSLSFMGWLILASMTFGLLLIYVLPYYTMAQVLFLYGCMRLEGAKPPEPKPQDFLRLTSARIELPKPDACIEETRKAEPRQDEEEPSASVPENQNGEQTSKKDDRDNAPD